MEQSFNTHKIRNKYNVIGIGQDISSVILADGVNEAGVAAAALYFPGYAQYDDASQDTRHLSIAALELVHFLPGQCASVEQVSYLLRTLRIVGTKAPVTNTVAPLHWIVADRSGKCITVEKTADALHITDNSPEAHWGDIRLNRPVVFKQWKSKPAPGNAVSSLSTTPVRIRLQCR